MRLRVLVAVSSHDRINGSLASE